MKIKVVAQVWIEEEVEVDDKFREVSASQYEELSEDDIRRLDALSEECLALCIEKIRRYICW